MLDQSVIEFLGDVVNNFVLYFIDILLRLPGVIVAVMVHGFAQALASTALGSKEPRAQKKLTLDPITHTDPVGFLCLLLFRFGWAYPVPADFRHKSYPKLRRFVAIFAGPFANLLVSFVGLFALIPFALPQVITFFNSSQVLVWTYGIIKTTIQSFCLINANIAIFNMIPLPPLDGFRLLSVFIPRSAYKNMMRYEKYFSLGFMIVLLIDYYFIGYVGDALLMGSNFILNDCFAGLINFIFFRG